MKISIITPSFNQAEFIEETIISVVNQSSDGFIVEHIVVDGASTDSTYSIIKKYSSIKVISEKDNGQSDALNKGFKIATGEIIGWLNSDDFYTDGTLKKIHQIFAENPSAQWVVGFCKIVDKNSQEIKSILTTYKNFMLKHYSFKTLLFEDYISQPAVFYRKSFLGSCGLIDETLHYAMDYDLWLRFAQKSKPYIVKDYLACFRRHGECKSEQGFEKQFKEADLVSDRYTSNKIVKMLKKINCLKNILIYKFYI